MTRNDTQIAFECKNEVGIRPGGSTQPFRGRRAEVRTISSPAQDRKTAFLLECPVERLDDVLPGRLWRALDFFAEGAARYGLLLRVKEACLDKPFPHHGCRA
jgi:hypothetical protein